MYVKMATLHPGRFFFTATILLLDCISGFSQVYNYHHLTINDGLPSNKVTAITQDPAGFMYFATHDGLVRYDGERMKIFTNNSGDSASIPLNKIKGLFTGSDGQIWCAHDRYGLSALNPLTGAFRRFEFKKITSNGMFNGYLNNIHEGADGKIYACTFGDRQSVFVVDPVSGEMKQFFLSHYDTGHILNKHAENVLNLHFYKDSLWLFGTTQGLVFFNPLQKKVWKLLQVAPDSSENWENFFDGFLPGPGGSLYIGSWGSGLHRYDPRKGTLESFKKVRNWSDLNSCSPQLFLDDSTILLTGWDVFLFHTNTAEIWREKQDLLNQYAIIGNASRAFRSADSTIWLSTLSGVNYFHPGENDFKTVYFVDDTERLQVNPKFEQHWIWYDPAARMYVINYFIHRQAELRFKLSVYDESFHHLFDLPNPVTNENTRLNLAGDLHGHVYFSGTFRGRTGLFELDLFRKSISPLSDHAPVMDSMWVSGLTVMQDTLLVTDLVHRQLTGFRIPEKKFLFRKPFIITDPKMALSSGTEIISDKKRNCLWTADAQGLFSISTADASLSRLHCDSLYALLKNNRAVYAITPDSKDNLWISHASGITGVNPDTKSVMAHFSDRMLPSVNSLQLFYDSSGFIWSDCSKGLLRLDASSGVVQLFNSGNGLQPLCYPGTSSLLANGKLLIPFPGGLLWYDTRKQEASPSLPMPQVISVSWPYGEQLQPAGHFGDSLVRWPYDRNTVTISFAAMHYRASSFVRYAHKLEAVDPGFVNTTSATVTYTNLLPGSYLFRLKSSADGFHWSPERLLTIIITPPWYRTWWFRALLVFVFLGLLISAYQYRISQVRKEERLQAGFRKQLMDMEMTALRSQMNPHFIFNSLNSINRYVMQNDRLTASEYIAKFGKLMRNVLENSRHETITLKQELDTLELYLQLEKLRFEDKFDFLLVVDEEVDAGGIRIPPLLIQPFAENSIWHGLMHKEEKGLLTIKAAKKSSGLLEICIEDDGVGRARAAELESKKATHPSIGMQVTSDRIRLINELYKQQNRILVRDLVSSDGEPCGTSVTLQIQLKKDTHEQSHSD